MHGEEIQENITIDDQKWLEGTLGGVVTKPDDKISHLH